MQEGASRAEPAPGALARATLFEFLISSGMKELDRILEEERTQACGPRYCHQEDRRASRFGYSPGELVLGGRRVAVRRPRARTVDGQEVILPSWWWFSREDPLRERALEPMVLGVTTRKYARSLEAVDDAVRVRGTSRSAVSRRFVAATQAALRAFLQRDLSDLDLGVLRIDGVHLAEHVILAALGIDAQGKKHVLGTWEGSTENATACRELLADLVARGLPTDSPRLVVIDGSKALAKAVREVFGRRARIQRCQVHKKRNVQEHLPEELRRSVGDRITKAYRCGDVAQAKRLLQQLARQLEAAHPSAAASLREGLDETLTVMALRLPQALERTLSSTNVVENLIGTTRRVTRNVKRWRGGAMILRWVVAAVKEAQRHFRRVRGYAGLSQLAVALRTQPEAPSLAAAA
jgi:transposase-like protein